MWQSFHWKKQETYPPEKTTVLIRIGQEEKYYLVQLDTFRDERKFFLLDYDGVIRHDTWVDSYGISAWMSIPK